MEVDVRKEWADYASLGCAKPGVLEQLAVHHSRPQELPDQGKESLVVDPLPQELHQHPVVDGVEVRGNVSFDDPEILLAFLCCPRDALDGIQSATVRAEPERVLTEGCLVDGFQNHPDCFLYNPIPDARYAQRA